MSLATELSGDTLARGYAGMTDEEAAADLNTKYRTRERTSMSGAEVKAVAGISGLTDTKLSQFLAWTSRDDLDPFGIDQEIAVLLFGNPSQTISDLAAARVEQISRAVELEFGVVKVGHVEEARR